MRIISGKYKGKKLIDNKFEHIRPTADMVKQALFTKLQFEVPNTAVLDLFCGTGGLGIEALSRGAKRVVFVDSDRRSVKLTCENLNQIEGDYQVFNILAEKFLNITKEKFDFIFIDPPYNLNLYNSILDIIYKKNILADNGKIVCESLKDEVIQSQYFELFDEKKYGSKKLTFFKNRQ